MPIADCWPITIAVGAGLASCLVLLAVAARGILRGRNADARRYLYGSLAIAFMLSCAGMLAAGPLGLSAAELNAMEAACLAVGFVALGLLGAAPA